MKRRSREDSEAEAGPAEVRPSAPKGILGGGSASNSLTFASRDLFGEALLLIGGSFWWSQTFWLVVSEQL